MGNRLSYLDQVIVRLANADFNIIQRSAVYETAAWGKTDQPAFLNQCLEIETHLSSFELLAILLNIEKEIGRKRGGEDRYGPRTIDIDLLLFNNEITTTDTLTLPHPQLPNRRFALMPLAAIAGSVRHPVLDKTIDELLEECNDHLPVKRFA